MYIYFIGIDKGIIILVDGLVCFCFWSVFNESKVFEYVFFCVF